MADGTPEQVVQHTATVGVQDTTVKDIQAAAKKVGASADARVTTGGYYQPDASAGGPPFSITFAWSE